MEQEVRRLKRLFKDPNPLFTAWLTEWREEAERKDTKMKYVYGMALKSLRQYPLPLTSGKSCSILKGFGTTLCARLDERLQSHIEQHGPLPALGIDSQVELGGPKPKPTSKKRTPKPKTPLTSPEPQPTHPRDGSPLGQSGKKRGEYRPRPGSGGYAILLTLRRMEHKPGYAGFLRKPALQEAAQPLCNASMTLPEAGAYYTAWSSMATLVKRKLVLREGNPNRFSLSEAGRELADRVEATPCTLPSQRACFDRLTDRPTSSNGVVVPPGPTAGQTVPRRPKAGRDSDDRLSYRATDTGGRTSFGTDSVSGGPAPAPLQYHYVCSSGGRVSTKDEAHVSLQGGRVGFLVRCQRSALQASGRSYWPDPTRPEQDGIVHVFLADEHCAAVCTAGPLSGPSPATVPRAGPGPGMGPLSGPPPAAVPRAGPGLGAISGPSPPTVSRAGPGPGTSTANDLPRRLHDMSDSDNDGELNSSHDSQSTSQSLPQYQKTVQGRCQSRSRSPPRSQLSSRGQSQSASQSLPQSQSSTRGRSQSSSQSLPRSQSQSQPGSSRKRQPTDFSAALKRLRSETSDEGRPTATASTSGSTASVASAVAAAALCDEDYHLLSDDDDDDAVMLVESPASSRLSQASSEDDIPLTRRVPSAASREWIPGHAPPTVDTGVESRAPPPTAAQVMREKAAAAAEARAGTRLAPPPSAARGSPLPNGSCQHRPPVQTKTARQPVMAEGNDRHSEVKADLATSSSGAQKAKPSSSKADAAEERPMAGCSAAAAGAPTETRDFSPTVVLQPGTFDVVLCVDNQETSGKSGPGACLRTYRDVILAELQKNGVVADVRKLSVGDFLWVARPRTGRQPDELVLPYIVERKRLDDLAQSIRGHRYREQKFRLKRCGIPNVIYLAEAMGSGPRAQHLGLPMSTLQQALANCQVVDGFRVKWTADQRETAAFLTLITRRLEQQYQYRQLEGCPRDLLPASPPSPGRPERLQLFSEFHQLSAKRQKLTARDMFAKMLLQLSGLSVDKAAAIVAVYPTVACLVEAYGRCGSVKEGEALLATLRAEKSGRPVGATVSRVVYHLYCDQELT